MAVRFDPSIPLAVDVHVQNKTYVYCQSALYELGKDSQSYVFFNEEEMWCNKEAVNGVCFNIFYSVNLLGRKNIILQFATCTVPFQWSCCLRVQYPHLHCWLWSTQMLSDGWLNVSLHRCDKRGLMWRFNILFITLCSFPHHIYTIFEGQCFV